ncbi:hypothetical protein [Clostridium tarantellae]|uniref:Uncharacterized protein n=1 Tax=Clostridium tarantellae TaxID=39493 RepID=A0A6I1MPH2_9CLOT|nr:hypothetical protein [Clostridium tarantellae]MPQ44027.1 hypothetical protein [Clostridium tarantellae]
MSRNGSKMNEMQGVSAHLEQVGPKWRKTGAKCDYNDNNVCKNSQIATYMGKCVGGVCVYDYVKGIKHKDIDKNVCNEVEKHYTDNKYDVETLINKSFVIEDMEDGDVLHITFVKEEVKENNKNHKENIKVAITSEYAQAILGKGRNEVFSVIQNFNGVDLKYRYKIVKVY